MYIFAVFQPQERDPLIGHTSGNDGGRGQTSHNSYESSGGQQKSDEQSKLNDILQHTSK